MRSLFERDAKMQMIVAHRRTSVNGTGRPMESNGSLDEAPDYFEKKRESRRDGGRGRRLIALQASRNS